MDLTPILPSVGAGSIITLAVIMVFTGKLIPRRIMKDWVTREIYQGMVEERNLWRTVALENHSDLRTLLIPTAEAAQKTFLAVDTANRTTGTGSGGGGG